MTNGGDMFRKLCLGVIGALVLSTNLWATKNAVQYRIDGNGAKPRAYRISVRHVTFSREFKPNVIQRSVLFPGGKAYSILERFDLGIQDGRWVLVFYENVDGKNSRFIIGNAENLDRITLNDGIMLEGYYVKHVLNNVLNPISGRVLPAVSYHNSYERIPFEGKLVGSLDLVTRWLDGIQNGQEAEDNMEVLQSIFEGAWEGVRWSGTFGGHGDNVEGVKCEQASFNHVFLEPVREALQTFDESAKKDLRKRLAKILKGAEKDLEKYEKTFKKYPECGRQSCVDNMKYVVKELKAL